MARHSFIQMSKLSNVKGRISYISDPKRQEYLYATFSTREDMTFWNDLAKECQEEFKRFGTEGKCMRNMLTTCPRGCAFHTRIIQNMLRISAQKNLNLSSRMMHTASKSLRERLLSYLSEQALEHRSSRFTIPFDRQQLADYLAVDRSAMSNELSKMQKDGLITYHKNEFTLNGST